jgi:CheY-like chemotaxis protein
MRKSKRKDLIVLVVEEEPPVASALASALRSHGYLVAGPVATVSDAILILEQVQPDLAVLKYELSRGTSETLLPVLERRGVQICVISKRDNRRLPPTFRKYPVLKPPFTTDSLSTFLESQMKRPGGPDAG